MNLHQNTPVLPDCFPRGHVVPASSAAFLLASSAALTLALSGRHAETPDQGFESTAMLKNLLA